MARNFRAFAALAAGIAFLFAQAATAAYACANPAPDRVAMAQMKAAMEMSGDGGLCEKHCTTGTVSLDVAKPAPSAMPAAAAVAIRVIELPQAALPAVPLRAASLSVAGPAPPLIRFTVLRI
jgi:hypothetical protein